MIDTTKLTKLYYAIGEVAAMFEVNASLIRFWEKEFGLIQPQKNKKGNRLFTPKDIATFSKIYDLVKVKGFTLDGARKALKSKNPVELSIENVSNEIIISRLEAIKSKLIKLKD